MTAKPDRSQAMECDPLIEEIVQLAREKWPEPYFDKWTVAKRNMSIGYKQERLWFLNVAVAARQFGYITTSVASAPDLPALRDKLKEMKEAEDAN